MRYFYVTFLTPMGPGAKYVKADKHPLHPEVEREIQNTAATRVAQANGGQLCDHRLIMIQNVIELEEEVAKARYHIEFFVDTTAKG